MRSATCRIDAFVWLCLLALPALAADQVPFLTPSSLSFVYQIGSFQPGYPSGHRLQSHCRRRQCPRGWRMPVGWSFSGASTSLSANRPVLFEIGINPRDLVRVATPPMSTSRPGASSQTVHVTLQVTAGPVLLCSPGIGILDVISAPAGVNPVQTIAVGTSNSTPLLMSATTTSPWLAIKATGSTIQISTDRYTRPPADSALGSLRQLPLTAQSIR